MVKWKFCMCVFAVWCLISVTSHVTHPSEVSVLRAVKKGVKDNMKRLSSWNKGDPCLSNWTGVICFNFTSADGYFHIKELQVMNKNLSGNLVPELGQLSQLKILDFMWNKLSGSIPKEIGNLTSLTHLLINGNNLTGSLPEELGNLSNLNRIQIDQNQLSGPIPKSFANLKTVKHLHFNNNSLSGQLPVELSTIDGLLHMLMDNNKLSGYLPPEYSKLSNLRIIQFDNNNFGGSTIPASYGMFTNLVKISLRNCSLRGGIPDLTRIANLSYIDLSWNQLSGSIPSNKYSNNITTIDLSHNLLNGSIPESFSYLPSLQRLSLANNLLSGSVTTGIWQNKSFTSDGRMIIDLRSNQFSRISGNLDPPENVTLRLENNPVCNNSNIQNMKLFCEADYGQQKEFNSTNSHTNCPVQACPIDNNFEYVPASPVSCFCAAPLKIGYRLKSPSFSHFLPFVYEFEHYLTHSLDLQVYQLSIESVHWEKGPRLRMYVKLFPVAGVLRSNTFNDSEVVRIRGLFSTWNFFPSDFFGPYELLNFTLEGPYAKLDPGSTQGKGISKKMVIVTVIVAIASSVIISALVTIFIAKRHSRYQLLLSKRRSSSRLLLKMDGTKSFTLKEMVSATQDFDCSTKIGQGGYGNVYRGELADKSIVAIKRAKEGSLQGEKEFLTEIELLSRLHHRNLVSLVGFCDEHGEQMLVYEFMPNGTLRDWLSAKSTESLNLGARVQIALGAAKGILYLHTEAQPPIFHRDIKASNILLDSKFTAKVADFGLSRLAPFLEEEGAIPDHVSTVVKGTPGYVDPEYFLTRKLTDKSDVYSFGVVLLEILTGMHPISFGKNIVREVNLAYQSGNISTVLDTRMGSCFPSECPEKFMSLALRCCEDKPENRPCMVDVVRELEDILHMIFPQLYASSDSKPKYPNESASTNISGDLYPVSYGYGSGALDSDITLTLSPR